MSEMTTPTDSEKLAQALPRDVVDELHALDRCMESQRALERQIDGANPGDPYASLMVADDIDLLERLKARVAAHERAQPASVQRVIDILTAEVDRGAEGLDPTINPNAIRAAIRMLQAQPASVPDGWVMVPRKPTGDMILAGISENNRDTGPHVFGRIYAAMLKAAPQPPAKESE